MYPGEYPFMDFWCFADTRSAGGDADSRQHLWGQGPFWFGGGRRARKERIEAVHAGRFFTQLRAARMRKTLLLLVRVY